MNILDRIFTEEKREKSYRFFRLIRGLSINKNIKYRQLQSFLNEHPYVVIIDVRSNQEYREGHVSKSINIPLYELERNINKVIPNLQTEILVYCKSGARSKKAVEKLKKKGYTNIYNIEDGIMRITTKGGYPFTSSVTLY
ncbi:MAG: rhodanese-like domain-containing protein [Clostridia bacterium]|nr:rhodanese-like domain-containing protein [Clostridia bacterium]